MRDDSRIFNPLALTLSRSVYKWHNHSMGTCLVGRLIPAFTWDLLPGSEIRMDVKSLFKMVTPVYPTMDYLYADIAFYFVPYKTVLSRRYGTPSVSDAEESWAGFIGAQDFAINMPVPASGVKLPFSHTGSFPLAPGCLGNYLFGRDGFFDNTSKNYPSALPYLAYLAIWNENYREPNIQVPVTWNFTTHGVSGRKYVNVQTTPQICIADCEVSSFRSGATPGTYVDAINAGLDSATPLPTSIFHGYFGSLLPWPQRNLTGVSLPVGGFAPLIVGSNFTSMGAAPRILLGTTLPGFSETGTTAGSGNELVTTQTDGTNTWLNRANDQASSNMGIDLSSTAAVNIEQLRGLITMQHWFEDIARSGNRMDELEYGTFGVRPKDSGCDRPMYLGGKRIQLDVEMVASTNGGTTSGSAAGAGSLGDLGAFSHTNDEGFYFHQGFDTWGALQCVFTIRSHNLFASGIDRQWLKDTREALFWPEFANVGNQSTKMIELTHQGSASDNLVLGYQEYAEEYREPRDLVTGLLDPRVTGGLDFMTYAHAFASTPSLAQLLDASRQYLDVDRTLSVKQSACGFQFIYQMTFDALARIPVGKYSFPGVSRV